MRGGYLGLDVHNLSIKLIGAGQEAIHFLPLMQLGSMVLGVRSSMPTSSSWGIPRCSRNQMGYVIPAVCSGVSTCTCPPPPPQMPEPCRPHLTPFTESVSTPSFRMSRFLNPTLRKVIPASSIHDLKLDLHLTKRLTAVTS